MADAAQEAAAAVFPDDAVATQEVEQPEQEVEAIPSFVSDTEGIEDLLEEPDYDDPAPVYQQQVEDDEYPDVAQLQAQLDKARKQLEYEQGLRVKDNTQKWREEAARRFPLSDSDEIQASSRRAFLKKAQEQHDRYERKIQPVIDKLDKLRADVILEAKTEGRAQSEQAWGAPTQGPQQPTVVAAEGAGQLDRRAYKSVQEMVKARFNHDPQFKDGI